MLILAIETSQVPGSIALCRDDVLLEERSLQPERRHAETLVPEIQRLLADHGYTANDCGGIAVSEGPGSFTGLRVGTTCAKTLAYAATAQLVAVPTLTAVAAQSPRDIDKVFVVSDAQRRQLFVGEFELGGGGQPRQIGDITIVDAEAWAGERTANDVVSGPALKKFQELFSGRCRMTSPECWSPRAATIAELGFVKIQAGELADPFSMKPFYLRPSAAEEKLADRSL